MENKKAERQQTIPERIIEIFEEMGYHLIMEGELEPFDIFEPLAIISANMDEEEKRRIIDQLKKKVDTFSQWFHILYLTQGKRSETNSTLIDRIASVAKSQMLDHAKSTDEFRRVITNIDSEKDKLLAQRTLETITRQGYGFAWWLACNSEFYDRPWIRELAAEKIVELVPDMAQAKGLLFQKVKLTADFKRKLAEKMKGMATTFKDVLIPLAWAIEAMDEKDVKELLKKASSLAESFSDLTELSKHSAKAVGKFPDLKKNPPKGLASDEILERMLEKAGGAGHLFAIFDRAFFWNEGSPELQERVLEKLESVEMDFHSWTHNYQNLTKSNPHCADLYGTGSFEKLIDLLIDKMVATAKSLEQWNTVFFYAHSKSTKIMAVKEMVKLAEDLDDWKGVHDHAKGLVSSVRKEALKRIKALSFNPEKLKSFEDWQEKAIDIEEDEEYLGKAVRRTVRKNLLKHAALYADWKFILDWCEDEQTKEFAIMKIRALVRNPQPAQP